MALLANSVGVTTQPMWLPGSKSYAHSVLAVKVSIGMLGTPTAPCYACEVRKRTDLWVMLWTLMLGAFGAFVLVRGVRIVDFAMLGEPSPYFDRWYGFEAPAYDSPTQGVVVGGFYLALGAVLVGLAGVMLFAAVRSSIRGEPTK